MPSHTKDHKHKMVCGVSDFDILANDLADSMADAAAARFQLPKAVYSTPIHYYKLIKRIQRRLATILINLPERKVERFPEPEPIPRVRLSQLLKETKHCIVYSSNRVTCNACMNSFPRLILHANRFCKVNVYQ
jgi:hypothetical protein